MIKRKHVRLTSAAAAFGALLGLAIPTSAAVIVPSAIQVHGHRGTRGTRPENTLSAFAEALRVGVDALELDMDVTKDGVLVVMHDQLVPPELCQGPGGKRLEAPIPIRSMTLAEFKALDCGSLPNPKFPRQVLSPQSPPTLDEVFDLVAQSTAPAAAKVLFNIETKSVPGHPEWSPEPAEFAELVAKAVKKRGLESRVIIQSFDHRTLHAIRSLLPKAKLSALTSDNGIDYVAVARSARARILSPDREWITAGDVRALHAAGVEVAPWTADDEAEWTRLADMGVDAIITDYPEDLIAWLKKTKR